MFLCVPTGHPSHFPHLCSLIPLIPQISLISVKPSDRSLIARRRTNDDEEGRMKAGESDLQISTTPHPK
ncbi:hypothetical protein CsSME_00023845 [Camellia sinensis var. sinensis]